MVRVYLSNISGGWSIQRQKEMLAEHVPGWPQVPTYSDVLPPAKRKAHSPASLIQRDHLLRETTRSGNVEAIVVCSYACLAWEQTDFLDCVASATARGATIIALDTGRRLTPEASPAELAEAMREFVKARRQSKSGPGRAGYLVSAERRATDARAGAMRIADRWRLPTKDYPTDDLLAEAGICRNTANLYLLNRPEAQRKHRNALAQAARNRSRRKETEQIGA